MMEKKDLQVIEDISMNQKELIDDLSFEKNFIRAFYNKYDRSEYDELICSYQAKQVFQESILEKNVDDAEMKGLNQAYTEIYNYNYSRKKGGKEIYDLYTTTLMLHNCLYKYTDHPEFGTAWRNSNAVLYDNPIDVPSWDVAYTEFYNLREKFNYLRDNTNKMDIVDYIDGCINISTEIIRIQPFNDGNKRTSRALLMLMLRKARIPMFSINKIEKKEYINALTKAMKEQDYKDLNEFIYTKICDAIFDFNASKQLKNKTQKTMISTVKDILKTYNIAEKNYDERNKDKDKK